MIRAAVHSLASLFLGTAAFFTYPMFQDQSFRGLDDPFPNIVVFQQGALGALPDNFNLSVGIRVDARDRDAHTSLRQEDIGGSSGPGAAILIGIEYHQGGFSYLVEPLDCHVQQIAGGEESTVQISITSLEDIFDLALREGAIGGVPDLSGSITHIQLIKQSLHLIWNASYLDLVFPARV